MIPKPLRGKKLEVSYPSLNEGYNGSGITPPKTTELIGVDAPQLLTELAIYSRHVKGERFVNVVFLGLPETGKTEIPAKYVGNPDVMTIRRFSHVGILNMLDDGIINIERPVTFVVPDLDAVFRQKPDVVDRTVLFLDSVTWDGLSPEATYLFDYRGLEKYVGFKAQLIAGVTESGFFTKYKTVKANLQKGGFISRMVVFSMDYSISQVSRIFDEIFDGSHRKKYVKHIPLDLPDGQKEVYLPKPQAEKLKDLTKDLAEKMGLRGFRLGQQFISLAKASVLREHRNPRGVTDDDVELVKYISEWINFDMKPLKPLPSWLVKKGLSYANPR